MRIFVDGREQTVMCRDENKHIEAISSKNLIFIGIKKTRLIQNINVD